MGNKVQLAKYMIKQFKCSFHNIIKPTKHFNQAVFLDRDIAYIDIVMIYCNITLITQV